MNTKHQVFSSVPTIKRNSRKGRTDCKEAIGKSERGQQGSIPLATETPLEMTLTVVGSQVQRLMGQRTKTLFPTSSKLLEPRTIKPEVVRSELQRDKQRQKQCHCYDKHTKQLSNLQPGQNIRVRVGKQWMPAVITSIASEPRSYNIRTPDGQEY